MKRNRKQKLGAIALEVCPSQLRLAIFKPHAEFVSVTTQSVRWREAAVNLHTNQGAIELRDAFRSLIEEHGLEGQRIYVTLNGDYCVTRVVTGTEERVNRELNDLEDRSALYLSLGPGVKALGGTIRQIDARHQHAMLSVVNEKTLNVLVDIADQVGVELISIEPSLASLARLIGHMGADSEGPVVIVNMNEHGVEVGITLDGQLLLDYRPTGNLELAEIAATIARHLGRLQRYCDRYVRFTNGRLERALLCGTGDLDLLRECFHQQSKLRVDVLRPGDMDANWVFERELAQPDLNAALGASMASGDQESGYAAPNLLERLETRRTGKLGEEVVRALWPVAAAVLLAAVAWFLATRQENSCHRLHTEMANYSDDQATVRELEVRIAEDNERLMQLEFVQSGLTGPRWHEITNLITKCLPDDAWLENIDVNQDGTIEMKGNSLREQGVFDFLSWMRKYPGFTQVVLNETEPTSATDAGRTGQADTFPVTRFDVRCRIAGRNDQEEPRDGEL